MFVLPQYTWDKDRELCKRCKHYRPSQDSARIYSGNLVMRCTANPQKGSKGIGTCIDNRTRGPCGKEARLFEAIGPVPDVAVYTIGTQVAGPLVQEEFKRAASD
jgi:hypothetical protein